MTTLGVDVLDLSDLSTVVASLDDIASLPPSNAASPVLRGEENDTGSGALFVHYTHPAFDEVRRGRVLAWKLDGVAKAWTLIDSCDNVTVAPREQIGKTIAGMGALSYVKRGLVLSRLGLGVIPIPATRNWNWTSNEYDDSAIVWEGATEIVRQDLAGGGTLWGGAYTAGATLPDLRMLTQSATAWDDPNAFWIGATGWTDTNAGALGTSYFRSPDGSFTPPATGWYRIEWAGSYYSAAWLDGVLLGETFSGGSFVLVQLSAGVDHTLALSNEVVSFSIDSPDHVGGVIASVLPCDEQGNVTGSPLLHTDSTWLVNPFPPAQPGMTPGEVWGFIIAEAQARGALTHIALDFDDDLDSFGNPWPEEVLMSTIIHTDYLTLAREFVAHAFVDIWATVEGDYIVLHMVPFGQRGTALASIDFRPVTIPDDGPSSGNITFASFRTVE